MTADTEGWVLVSTCRHCGVPVRRVQDYATEKVVWIHEPAGAGDSYWYCQGVSTVAGPTVDEDGVVMVSGNVLTGQVPVGPPSCENHREVQHRDGKPPWCRACGWNHGRPATPARQIKEQS